MRTPSFTKLRLKEYVLVHYHEIGLKGELHPLFENQLVTNL